MPFSLESLSALGGGLSANSGSSSTFVAPFQRDFLKNLFQQGQNTLNQTLPLAQQLASQLPDQLINPAFQSFQQLSNPQANPFLEQQIQNQNNSLGQFFNEQLLPGINRSSVATGGLGGARNQLAQAQGAERVARAAAEGETALRFQGFQQAQQNQLGALSQANNLVNLGLSPSTAPFAPLQAQQGVLGPPIILSESKSSGGGFSL